MQDSAIFWNGGDHRLDGIRSKESHNFDLLAKPVHPKMLLDAIKAL